MRKLFLFLACWTFPAHAQTTTTCRSVFGQTICDTTAPPQGVDWNLAPRGFNSLEVLRAAEIAQRERQMEEQRQEFAAREAELARREQEMRSENDASHSIGMINTPPELKPTEATVQAAKLVVAGECSEALAVAFMANDAALADNISRVCRNSDEP